MVPTDQMRDLRRSTACWWVILKYLCIILFRVDFMRSKRSFLLFVLRYLKQFITHYHNGYLSRRNRYSLTSSTSAICFQQMRFHMMKRETLGLALESCVCQSSLQIYRGIDRYSLDQSISQKEQSHVLLSFCSMNCLRFIVSQFRKSKERYSSGLISLRANTISAPFMWIQLQLARHSCRKAQSFYQMPRIQVFAQESIFQMVFQSSRHLKHFACIQLIYNDSLE